MRRQIAPMPTSYEKPFGMGQAVKYINGKVYNWLYARNYYGRRLTAVYLLTNLLVLFNLIKNVVFYDTLLLLTLHNIVIVNTKCLVEINN